ncbi:MAG: Gfo/Idh/MocA family oxidoreductase [Acidobacteria bacterium]|nr:Gfo/Idh/MocA family oxidoreductase [Acidobacteriota bacterium]
MALAGAGMISMIHAIAARAAGLPILAVASRTEARAAERAEQIGCPAVAYADLPAGADVVVVATPPALHTEQTIAALAAGASVLVEKPLATTLAEADAIVEAAADAAGHVIYAENQAFAPVVSRALGLIAELGPLEYLEVRALSPRPTWGDFLSPTWGGGCLFDLGAHPIALALLMAGDDPAVSVTARLERSPDIEVDDLAVVELQFASGLRARLEVSWRDTSTTWDLQASSDIGVVRAELLPTVGLERDGEPVGVTRAPSEVDQFVHDLGYIEQLREVRRVVTGRAPSTSTPIDASFGRHVLEIICAAYASAGADAPVDLPFTGSRALTPHELAQ